jgi:2-polyprenyl-3-methyl-5-hydroxy-6-metoxy-1,4-benzoquinol methylase
MLGSTLLSDVSFRLGHGAKAIALRAKRRMSRSGPRPGFFDDHPRFMQTSETLSIAGGADANRLNERHRAIIEANRDVLSGARVLDLASHDGRWSYAALKAGASHVTGIEARQHLVEAANGNLMDFTGRYDFRLGDVFSEIDHLNRSTIDVVMCLGFLYHVADHMLLLTKIAKLRPRHIILDTSVTADARPVVLLNKEEHERERDGAKVEDEHQSVIAGVPSLPALELMLSSFGWRPRYYDWNGAGITHWTDIEDYHEGTRVTLRVDC